MLNKSIVNTAQVLLVQPAAIAVPLTQPRCSECKLVVFIMWTVRLLFYSGFTLTPLTDIKIKITCSGLQPLSADSCSLGGTNND